MTQGNRYHKHRFYTDCETATMILRRCQCGEEKVIDKEEKWESDLDGSKSSPEA